MTLDQINPVIFYGMGFAIITLLIFAFFIFALSKRAQVVYVFCLTSLLLFFEVMAHLEILPISIDPNINAFLMSFLLTIFTMLLLGLIIEKINYSKNNLTVDTVNNTGKKINLIPTTIGALIGLGLLLGSMKRGMVSWETVFPKLWYIVASAILFHFLGLVMNYLDSQLTNNNTTKQNKGE